MGRKLHILTLLALLVALSSRAQDPHFTQFFSSPLTLNPAFTGLFTGQYRVAANYRSQWGSIATPFVTGTVSADMGILKNIINPNDILGVGLLTMYDETGGGGLKTEYAALSASYQKSLDVSGNSTLGLGIQTALVQKRLDFSKLIFEDQLTSNGFDPSVPNGEYFPNSMISYPDFNVGLLFNDLVGKTSSFYVGGSYYHITQPRESFLGGKYQLHSRYTLHAGGTMSVDKNTQLYVSGLFMQQSGAQEEDLGAALGLMVNNQPQNPTIFYVGTWYRFDDAINPYIGLEFNNFQMGMSYDVNVSSLQSASLHRGGFEISLIYIQPNAGPDTKRYKCPRF